MECRPRAVAPHLPVLAALDEPADGDREAFLAARDTLDRVAGLLRDAGAYRTVATLCTRLLDAVTPHLVADHPDALTSRSNLAHALDDLGDYRQAADLHRTTLAARERVLGPDHPHTLTSRSNLARAEAALRRRPRLRLSRPRPADRVEGSTTG